MTARIAKIKVIAKTHVCWKRSKGNFTILTTMCQFWLLGVNGNRLCDNRSREKQDHKHIDAWGARQRVAEAPLSKRRAPSSTLLGT